MKILVFYPFETGKKAFSGGIPKVIVNNLHACVNLGYDTHLVLPKNNEGLIEHLRKERIDVTIHDLDFKPLSLYSDTKGVARFLAVSRNLRDFVLGIRRIKSSYDLVQPDIIHYHEIVNFPILHLHAKSKKILHLHSYRFTNYKIILPLMFSRINSYADLVLSPTNSILRAVKHRVKVNSMQIDTPYLDLSAGNLIQNQNPKFEQSKIVFAFVGRICRIKRIHSFIEALGKLQNNKRKNLEFWIIGGTNYHGDEQYRIELEKLIADFHLQRTVLFKGYIDPIETALQKIDYGVILSESEAVPMIGIEFMKFNIPIIGFDAPGINDFLIHKENGFLIPNGNVEVLSDTIEEIIDCGSEKYNFSKVIPGLFERHSLTSFQAHLKKIYEKLAQ